MVRDERQSLSFILFVLVLTASSRRARLCFKMANTKPMSSGDLDLAMSAVTKNAKLEVLFAPRSAAQGQQQTVWAGIAERIDQRNGRRSIKMRWQHHPGNPEEDDVLGMFPQTDLFHYYDVSVIVEDPENGRSRKRFVAGAGPGSRPVSRAASAADMVADLGGRMDLVDDALTDMAAASTNRHALTDDGIRARERLDRLESVLSAVPSAADFEHLGVRIDETNERLEAAMNAQCERLDAIEGVLARLSSTIERIVTTYAPLTVAQTVQSTAPQVPTPTSPADMAALQLHDVATWPCPVEPLLLRQLFDWVFDELVNSIKRGPHRNQAVGEHRQLVDLITGQRQIDPEGWKKQTVILRANRIIFAIKAIRSESEGRATAVEVLKHYDSKFPAANNEADPFFALAESQSSPPPKTRAPADKSAPGKSSTKQDAKAPTRPSQQPGGVPAAPAARS